MTGTRTPWHSKPKQVPYRASPDTWAGFRLERIRAPHPGRDAGLYVVRTPEGRSRVAIVRGLPHLRPPVPHRVCEIVDGTKLGVDVVRFYPSVRRIPSDCLLINAVGDFRAALEFALDRARTLALTPTLEEIVR